MPRLAIEYALWRALNAARIWLVKLRANAWIINRVSDACRHVRRAW